MCALRLSTRAQSGARTAPARKARPRAHAVRAKKSPAAGKPAAGTNGTKRDEGTTLPETPMRNDSFMPEPTVGYEPCA